jgi:hypothetical protein
MKRVAEPRHFCWCICITSPPAVYLRAQKLRSLREDIKDHNSGHGDPAFSAMETSWEQELSLQLCIIAGMQRKELSDSRNRQAAGNQGEQNEGQIWQRGMGLAWG